MRDVASRAGVSLKTVSRVLNGEPGVMSGTSERVRLAISELGFTRNDIAAGLRRRGQATASLGLVIEDVANPFYSALTRAVEESARARGYLLFAGSSSEDPEQERELVQAFCARRVDGLIIVPAASDHSYLSAEVALGTSVVFADRPPSRLDADAVLTANVEGAFTGVTHILAHGHRRVAFLGDVPAISTAAERLQGYREALTAKRIRVDKALVRVGVHDADAAEEAVRELLALTNPPTAIFTGNNLLTVGAYRVLRTHHRPIALVGFDDFALADLLDPPVTVVAHDAAALGRASADLLFARLDNPTRPTQVVTLPTRLLVRGSGEVRP
jgi:LacI family transcriptional regulator